jgi:hypothetical protein
MKIKDRISDGLFLWENEHYEGALLCVLIAFSATSRLRYPDRNKIGDKEAFERFYRDSTKAVANIKYKRRYQPIEHILYKWLRCALVHEGGISPDIKFIQTKHKESKEIMVY